MSAGDLIFLTQNDILRKGDFPMVLYVALLTRLPFLFLGSLELVEEVS